MRASDVVVVGGGIAGAAMATVLSRAGLGVVLLERQSAYRDRVRGECMPPWGVEEARRLGLLDVLVEAGAQWLTRHVGYDEIFSQEETEARASSLGQVFPNVPGALSFYHPSACQALMLAAARAGAHVRTGVRSVTVTAGEVPEVVYQTQDSSTALRCRLVIGADGRTSHVRGQAGIRLERMPAPHLITGMLVKDIQGFPEDVFVDGVEGDLTFFIFPQGGGRARLYLCHALFPPDRFAGSLGPPTFLRSYRLRCVPDSDAVAAAKVAGPCATLECDDTWTREPFAGGVVLIGDAAGYNNPLIGQGLSLALRDVRVLSALLLGERDWSPRTLRVYGDERAERMRRVRIEAALVVELNVRGTPRAQAQRRLFAERIAADPELAAPMEAILAGPQAAPAEAFTPGFIGRLLGPREVTATAARP